MVLSYTDEETFIYSASVTQLAVGYGAGVWAVNSSNQVFTFVRP